MDETCSLSPKRSGRSPRWESVLPSSSVNAGESRGRGAGTIAGMSDRVALVRLEREELREGTRRPVSSRRPSAGFIKKVRQLELVEDCTRPIAERLSTKIAGYRPVRRGIC